MLLGVQEKLGDALVADGHRLRIYVPYGEHWYAYSMRRLQENPKIAGYIAADTFGRLIPGETALEAVAARLPLRRRRRQRTVSAPRPRRDATAGGRGGARDAAA